MPEPTQVPTPEPTQAPTPMPTPKPTPWPFPENVDDWNSFFNWLKAQLGLLG
jgi:hypothetical protein